MAESSGRDRPSAAAAALPARPWLGVELISRSQSLIQRDGVVPHAGANRRARSRPERSKKELTFPSGRASDVPRRCCWWWRATGTLRRRPPWGHGTKGSRRRPRPRAPRTAPRSIRPEPPGTAGKCLPSSEKVLAVPTGSVVGFRETRPCSRAIPRPDAQGSLSARSRTARHREWDSRTAASRPCGRESETARGERPRSYKGASQVIPEAVRTHVPPGQSEPIAPILLPTRNTVAQSLLDFWRT
jgi:hypothetical protein